MKSRYSVTGFAIVFYKILFMLLTILFYRGIPYIVLMPALLRTQSSGSVSDADAAFADSIDRLSQTPLFSLMISFIIYLVGLYVVLKMTNLKEDDRFLMKRKRLSVAEYASFFFMAFALGVTGGLVGQLVSYLISLVSGKGVNNTLENSVGASADLYLLISVVILPPIFEELVYRWAVISSVKNGGLVSAILLSSIIFGLIHEDVYQFFYTILLGFLFSYIYVLTGNILYSISIHMAFNFIGTFLPVFMGAFSEDGEKAAIIFNVFEYGLAVLGYVCLFLYIKKKKYREVLSMQNDGYLKKEMFLNPGMMTLIVFCLIYTVLFMF